MFDPENLPEAAEAALRQSWEVHRQAFGPILEPAFQENQQVRILLINALNRISRREVKEGLELLKQIQPFCNYNEDKAAWAFFVGLCFEMAGAKKQMLQWYADAGKFHHRFYLPYLKLAKAAHGDGELLKARNYYVTAIRCLLETEDADRDEVILGSACTNLCSCLVMLHQYPEAEAAWLQAQKYPLQPGAHATAAILYAAMGREAEMLQALEQLRQTQPAMLPQIEEMTRQIRSGTHPDFPPKQP